MRRLRRDPFFSTLGAVRVGVPKELKPGERRVALTPAGTRELVMRGHQVWIERGAGVASGFSDSGFEAEGARIAVADHVYRESELILKVKEPQPPEIERLRGDQVLFTYLHLAADPDLAQSLCDSGATCIAYETVEGESDPLPLLAPMSEIAGRLGAQVGADSLMSTNGGSGKLLGGIPGVQPARVLILGGGVAGTNAARIAHGMGGDTIVLDQSLSRLRAIDAEFGTSVQTAHATSLTLERLIEQADLVVGSVLVRGARAPRLVSRALLAQMRLGSVVVDISVDQGGCFETSRPTSHADPTFVVDGVVHY
ncbi:MAG: alanine dehydrogenase, partial [Gaiellaceae bacterium]